MHYQNEDEHSNFLENWHWYCDSEAPPLAEDPKFQYRNFSSRLDEEEENEGALDLLEKITQLTITALVVLVLGLVSLVTKQVLWQRQGESCSVNEMVPKIPSLNRFLIISCLLVSVSHAEEITQKACMSTPYLRYSDRGYHETENSGGTYALTNRSPATKFEATTSESDTYHTYQEIRFEWPDCGDLTVNAVLIETDESVMIASELRFWVYNCEW